jgi:hypothetical protein
VSGLEQLIIDMKESLEREIHGLETKLERKVDAGFRELNTRFDTQAARPDRQGALLQSGSRMLVRMNGWAEKVDAALEQKDREIAELRQRIDRLESGGSRQ